MSNALLLFQGQLYRTPAPHVRERGIPQSDDATAPPVRGLYLLCENRRRGRGARWRTVSARGVPPPTRPRGDGLAADPPHGGALSRDLLVV